MELSEARGRLTAIGGGDPRPRHRREHRAARQQRRVEVKGEGAVTVIDAGAMTYTSLPYAEEEKNLSLFGVRVHVLSDGHKFNLHSREPVVEEKAKRAKSSNSDGGAGASETGKKRAGKARPAKIKRKQ